MPHYKYVHLMLHNELKFNGNLVKLFKNDDSFNYSDHLFVTPHENVYKELKEFDVVYDKQKAHKLINKYSDLCDWIFVHQMCPPIEIIRVKKRCLKKIVWRTWGGDAGYTLLDKGKIKNILKSILNKMTRKRYMHIRLVGIADSIDRINIEKKIGKIKTLIMPYESDDKHIYEKLLDIRSNSRKETGTTNVLIEHSGFDDQISIMKKLEKFKDENIHLYSILSYGNKVNIEAIKQYINSVWGDKATVITNFMPYIEFSKFISSMDIGIFGKKSSYALGSIHLLVFFRKKIYLHQEGIIKEGFVLEGIPYDTIDKIEHEPFDVFSSHVIYPDNVTYSIEPINYEKGISCWNEIFDYLKSLNKEACDF